MTVVATTAVNDDAVFIDVTITPLPTPSPTMIPPVPVGPPTGGGVGQNWLAATGFEPEWLVIGAAAVAVTLGVMLLRARSRRP